MTQIVPLNRLSLGQRGRVTKIAADGLLKRRILDMGVTSGTELLLKGMAPLGDPLEVLVKGYRLSLRKDEASRIMVEVN